MNTSDYISPIENSAGDNITLASIGSIVESPLLQACTILYKKGIRTTTSSANHKNDFPKGNITIGIDESTLSNENKQIIFSIPEKFHPSVKINITGFGVYIIMQAYTPDEAIAISTAVANCFRNQKPLWVNRYTARELRRAYRDPKDAYKGSDGYYYDNKEHADMYAHLPINEQVAYLLRPQLFAPKKDTI